jgi:hypothetical protein
MYAIIVITTREELKTKNRHRGLPVCIYVQADADLNLSRADVEKHRMNRHGGENLFLC